MSVVQSLYDYFKSCPLLADDRKLNVDFLPEEKREYCISVVPTAQIVRRYMDGSSKRQYLFVFGSSEFCDADVLQNLENSGFYELFAEWLEDQTKKKLFPAMEDGKRPYRLEATTSGYLNSIAKDGTAKYQIQCKLEYYQQGER